MALGYQGLRKTNVCALMNYREGECMLVFFYLLSIASGMIGASASMQVQDLKAFWRDQYQQKQEEYGLSKKGLANFLGVHTPLDRRRGVAKKASDNPNVAKRANMLFDQSHMDSVIFVEGKPSVLTRVLTWGMDKTKIIYLDPKEQDAVKLEQAVWDQVLPFDFAKNPNFPDHTTINRHFGIFKDSAELTRLLQGAYLLYAFVPQSAGIMSVEKVQEFWSNPNLDDSYLNKVIKMSGLQKHEIREAFENLKTVMHRHPVPLKSQVTKRGSGGSSRNSGAAGDMRSDSLERQRDIDRIKKKYWT